MAVELDSFFTKFKNLWASGHEATLTVNSRNGKVWMNLHVGLQCPQPHHGGHAHHQGQGNARQRRNIRRAAARAATVTEEVTRTSNIEEKDDAIVEDAVEKIVNPNVTLTTEIEVTNQGVEEPVVPMHVADSENSEASDIPNFVESILVTPDCQTGWKDNYISKLINDKLLVVNLKMKSIQINRRWGSFISCLVKIEPVERKEIENIDFAIKTKLKNWKLDIM